MSAVVNEHIIRLDPAEIASYQERQKRGERLADEAERLKRSLRDFVRAAWGVVWPNVSFVDGWHIDAICEHLEAVSDGEIRRLQVWVPPGTMKSTTVSILWPTWEWTHRPEVRYITASYAQPLATRFAVKSRDLIRHPWYQSRFPHVELKRDHDLKQSYANTNGGERAATSPGGEGTGIHGDRILIDDPINALEVTSEAALEQVIEWHDGTIATRFTNPKESAEVIIMQRLHERDLAGHVLEQEDWTVLCLPEAYEARHPFVYAGDRRTVEGELLWPERVGPAEHVARLAKLGAYRAAGQLQQRPAAREGAIIKREHWRYYSKAALEAAEEGDVSKLPRFQRIVCSWDTTFKDKNTSDYVAGGCWAAHGGDRYLLRTFHQQTSLSATKTAMKEMRQWALDRWPHLPVTTLVENTANGPEIIAQLQREVTGVVPTRPSVSADQPSVKKTIRAEACEPDFEGGNVHVPGEQSTDLKDYEPSQTPPWVQAVIEEASAFPTGAHDDLVDMTTQALNWLRSNVRGKSGITRAHGRMPRVGQLGA